MTRDGLFTVSLNFGACLPRNARGLEIGVRPGRTSGAYTVLTPRQALGQPIGRNR